MVVLSKPFKGGGGYIDGIELSDEKCRMLFERTGIQMKPYNILTDFEKMECYENKYDIVSMHYVLEHISNPHAFINQAKKFLKKNGKIYIEVPNYDYYLNFECKALCDFNYSRKHLSYFTAKTLKQLLKMNNYTDVMIYGNQFYGVENALNWLKFGEPVKQYCQLDSPKVLEFVDSYYKQYLEDNLTCDHLIAIGTKCD